MKEEMVKSDKKFLFLAIKPEFALKIISKEKTIELRKQRPQISIGDYIIIYASSPMKCVIGYSRIKMIIENDPFQMWTLYKDNLGIDKDRYTSYFNGCKKAIGIELDNVRQCNPISLNQLRYIDPNFRPPQGFKYISSEQICMAIEKFIIHK